MDLARCGEIGPSQDGLITRHQAMKFLSKKRIATLERTSAWRRVHEAVFVINGSPPTWRQRVRAAVLTRQGNAIASHETAAFLWCIVERAPKKIEILMPFNGSARTPETTVHRTRNWHIDIATEIDGIALTIVARTIIDLSAVTGIRTLRKAVDLAITGRLVTLDGIAAELERIGSQGRAKCSLLFDVLSLRDPTFEKTDHISEAKRLEVIQRGGLPTPVPQFRIVLDKRTVARPDFVYPHLKIAIECVSWRWHGGPSKFEEDIQRRAKLRAAGWLVVEISTKTFSQDAVSAIRSAINERS